MIADAQRVTVVSSPAGSGKSSLVRSWIDDAGLTEDTAWVPVRREERDPQALWLSVLDSLRGTCPGSALVRELTAAPHLDGWTVVERLLEDLGSLWTIPGWAETGFCAVGEGDCIGECGQ